MTTAAVVGLEGSLVEVQVDIAHQGLPNFFMVGLPSTAVKEARERVRTAIKNSGLVFPLRQWQRFVDLNGITCNAEMRVPEVRTFCELESSGAALVRGAVERLGLSARAYRVLRVARTIADLAGEGKIQPMQLAEAIQYQPRSPER